MLVRNPKPFNLGLALAISFFAIFIVIFMPVFGEGRNGLQFSDDLFNKLSKGSSYFIPGLMKTAEKSVGTNFSVTVKLDKPEQVEKAVKIFIVAGASVAAQGSELKLSGDLGKVLQNVLKDSDAMYKNEGDKVKSLYGMDERDAMALIWTVLNKSIKEFQKAGKVSEAEVVNDILKKGVEPAYNYYGIEGQSVADKAATMTALLVFYVIYTMWWGYAIFFLFDGMGLSMKKAKVKKEV